MGSRIRVKRAQVAVRSARQAPYSREARGVPSGAAGPPPQEPEKQKIIATQHTHDAAASDRAREEKGATAVEYGLLVGLIAVAIIATVALLGDQLNTLFTTITDALP